MDAGENEARSEMKPELIAHDSWAPPTPAPEYSWCIIVHGGNGTDTPTCQSWTAALFLTALLV